MSDNYKTIKAQAQSFFANNELGHDEETLITLFLSGIKTANVLVLSKIEMQPMAWEPYRYMHQQYFKDYELHSLLLKATHWSYNPIVYAKGAEMNYRLWTKGNLPNYVMGMFNRDSRFFRYLALSHAFKTEIRFISLFPATRELDTPFLSTLYDIEVENGKEIQMQAGLLKSMDVPNLTIDEKEQLVREQRELVISHFSDFLEYLINRNNK